MPSNPGKKSIPSFPPPIPRFLPRKPGGISNREKKKTDSFHGNSNKLHDRSHSQPPETRLRIRAIGWWAVWGGRTEGSSPEGNDLWPTSQPWYCYPFPWTAAKYSISTNLSPLALQILYLYHLSLPLSFSRKHGNFVPLPLYRCSCTLWWCLADYCRCSLRLKRAFPARLQMRSRFRPI